MDESKLVSLIIPVYNGEKYVERCLQSICRQTYNNIEVIVVDDGSIDKTLNIIRKYSSLDNRIKYFSKENSGVSATRNFALGKISGEYVFFVDVDDWIDPKMVEDNLRIIVENNVDIVINDFYYNQNGLKSVSETFSVEMGNIAPDIVRRTLIASDNMNSQCISLYSAKIIRKNNIKFPENIKYGEDNIFNLTYVDFIETVFYSKKAFYHYEIHKESGCRRLYNDQLEMYEKQFEIKKNYGTKWGIWDKSITNDLIQLIGTHLAAFSLMAQKEKKYSDYKDWMKRLYNTTTFKWLVENRQNLIINKVPRAYRLLVKMMIKRSELISYMYCVCLNYKLGQR